MMVVLMMVCLICVKNCILRNNDLLSGYLGLVLIGNLHLLDMAVLVMLMY